MSLFREEEGGGERGCSLYAAAGAVHGNQLGVCCRHDASHDLFLEYGVGSRPRLYCVGNALHIRLCRCSLKRAGWLMRVLSYKVW